MWCGSISVSLKEKTPVGKTGVKTNIKNTGIVMNSNGKVYEFPEVNLLKRTKISKFKKSPNILSECVVLKKDKGECSLMKLAAISEVVLVEIINTADNTGCYSKIARKLGSILNRHHTTIVRALKQLTSPATYLGVRQNEIRKKRNPQS